jgi:hypothetical protein
MLLSISTLDSLKKHFIAGFSADGAGLFRGDDGEIRSAEVPSRRCQAMML